MRHDDDRHFPPGVVPGAVGAIGALAAAVLVAGLIFGALLALCDRREPVQMIPPAATSTAIATASAQATASQSVRVTVRRPSGYNRGTLTERDDGSSNEKAPRSEQSVTGAPGGYSFGPDEIVIEVSQTLTAAATSSAGASTSVISPGASVISDGASVVSHGRLGIIAATLPGILAADLQLLRLDVSPLTRWLVDVPLEVGLDVAGNLEAGAVGVSAGGKAFVGVYYWSRWNLSQQGLALGVGLRF